MSQTNLVRRIMDGDGKTLANLDINSGDFVAFDNSDIDPPSPFLIVLAREKIMSGKLPNPCGVVNDLYLTHSGETQRYMLSNKGTLSLYSPSSGIVRLPHFSSDPVKNYHAESAFVGQEEILNALQKRSNWNLDVYVPWLQQEFERLRSSR